MALCFFICAGILLVFNCAAGDNQAPVKTKKILLVHSYHPEYPWVAAISEGVKRAIEEEKDKVGLEIFYMDTKRKTSQEWKVEAGKLAQEKIEQWQPDAVITADDNAQIFVTQQYSGKERPFFVFCGVNADPEDYGLPASNVTGIVEKPHFAKSLELANELLIRPIRRVAVISDDGATSMGALDYMHSRKVAVKVLDYRLIGDFDTWKERVLQYNVDADALFIYMYHTIKEKGSRVSLEPAKVMEWTIKNCSIPTIGFFDFSIEDGIFCGAVESGQEHGYEAAKMALALISGTDIAELPVKTAKKSVSMINLKTAEKSGFILDEEKLLSIGKVIK